MALQDDLDALKAKFESQAPKEVADAIRRGINELNASRQAERAVKIGDRAPAFSLPDTRGNLVSSNSLLRAGPLVVSFYRGNWCPYCNLELQAIEAVASEIRAVGASIVAISPQTIPNSRKSERENRLSFQILSDRGGGAAASFGLRWVVPDYLREVHRKVGADLTIFNGDTSWTLSMPARYIIAPDGVVA